MQLLRHCNMSPVAGLHLATSPVWSRSPAANAATTYRAMISRGIAIDAAHMTGASNGIHVFSAGPAHKGQEQEPVGGGHQNRKYRCAIGSSVAGSQVSN